MASFSTRVSRRIDYVLIVILAFFAGIYNIRKYMPLLGVAFMENVIVLLFSLFVILNISLIYIQACMRDNREYFMRRYWIPLLVVVLFKFLLWFVEDPRYFLTNHSSFALGIVLNLTLVWIFATRIGSLVRLKQCVLALGVGCSTAPIIGLFSFPFLIGSRPQWVRGHYISGGFWNPSVVGFVSSAWLLVASITVEPSKHHKRFSITMSLLMCVGGLAGLSRATLLVALVSVAWYLFRSKNIKTIAAVGLISALFLALMFGLFGTVVENLVSRVNIAEIGNEARVKIWISYLSNLNRFFLVGAPIDGHKVFSNHYQDPHSILLNWWSIFGIFGLLGFIWLMWGLTKSSRKVAIYLNHKQGLGIATWIVSYLSLALINQTGFSDPSFYAAMGLILAWGNIANSKQRTNCVSYGV